MTEPPSNGELERRIVALESSVREGFIGLNTRLDDYPTEKTQLALFHVRDTQINTMQIQLSELVKALADERAARVQTIDEERRERNKEIKALESKADAAKRWAVSTLISGVVGAVAVFSFLINTLGGSTT